MNIIDYIKSNETLSRLDLLTVYTTIREMMKDGFVMQRVD